MKHNISELKPGAHIHIMGICGTAMGNFAGLLQSMGYKVTGSDQNVYPPMSDVLKNLGISIYQGYKKENLNPKPDFVVVGNVITKSMEEAEALLASDIAYASFPESIGDMLLKNSHSIVVCGTHGKTTTTAMMAWMASELHQQPGYLIGGVPKNFDVSFAIGGGKYFIIEGDEYDTAFFDKVPKFKHYFPKSAILTSVEFDHADIYKDLNDVLSAFKILMEKLPVDGNLVYHFDDQNIAGLLEWTQCQNKVSYGFNKKAQFRIEDVKYTDQGTSWTVVERKAEGREVSTLLTSSMSGDHNILNFTANFALATQLGWDQKEVVKAITTFQGVKRRQEILGEFGGVLVIEDFAHHPTAVKVTLEGLKKKYAGRRLLAAFEPRSATSRKSIFQKDYVGAFDHKADHTFIMQAYVPQGKTAEEDGFSAVKLVEDLKVQGNSVCLATTYEELVSEVLAQAKPHDVLVLMSNGGFGGIYSQITKGLGASR